MGIHRQTLEKLAASGERGLHHQVKWDMIEPGAAHQVVDDNTYSAFGPDSPFSGMSVPVPKEHQKRIGHSKKSLINRSIIDKIQASDATDRSKKANIRDIIRHEGFHTHVPLLGRSETLAHAYGTLRGGIDADVPITTILSKLPRSTWEGLKSETTQGATGLLAGLGAAAAAGLLLRQAFK